MATERRTHTRRSFLDLAIGACSALMGAALALPALAYLWPAARGGPRKNVLVEGAATLTPGQSTSVQVAGHAVIVVRHASGFRAFSAVCTHLGCLVKWDGERRAFLCPCHAGVFNADGTVASGPPPDPLAEYGVVTMGDDVYVTPPQGGAA